VKWLFTYRSQASHQFYTPFNEEIFMEIAAVLHNYAINVPKQAQSKPSPTTYVGAQPTSAQAPQEARATASTNQGQYDASVEGLAGLLSTQGQVIMPPNMMLALHASQQSGVSAQSTSIATGPADAAPVTASEVAGQMIDSLGSNGVLTVADVENAENGSTSPDASTSLDANSDTDIAADFAKLTGGTGVLTASQLTGAIQKYMDTQSERPKGFVSRILPQPV
jgi:hypothetical protein